MENTISGEAELARNVKIVVSSVRPLQANAINHAIWLIDREAQRLLKLRKNSVGESISVRGTGEILGNVLSLTLQIPLDTRYKQENEERFNRAWSQVLRNELGIYSGGYVAVNPEKVKNTTVIEIDKTPEEVAELLGGFGKVLSL